MTLDSPALLTDLYQLTMAYGYWKSGRADHEACFHLFFRRHPFAGSAHSIRRRDRRARYAPAPAPLASFPDGVIAFGGDASCGARGGPQSAGIDPGRGRAPRSAHG